MSKLEKKIEEAPNYLINEDGLVLNATTKGAVAETKGSVRLIVFGMRKSFKVADLKAQYFPVGGEVAKEEIPAVEEIKPEEKLVKKPKAKTKTKSDVKKDVKKVDNGGKKDKAFYDKVRKDFDKNPEKFDIMKYSKGAGVSYGRIWSIIKLHKAKIESDKKAKKNEK